MWLGFSLLSLLEVPILAISLRILGLFNFIEPPYRSDNLNGSEKSLQIYEGMLCLVDFVIPDKCLNMYLMLEIHQWVFQHRVFLEKLPPNVLAPANYIKFSCLNKGKLIILVTQGRWGFYDIKSGVFEAVEVDVGPRNIQICHFEESSFSYVWLVLLVTLASFSFFFGLYFLTKALVLCFVLLHFVFESFTSFSWQLQGTNYG